MARKIPTISSQIIEVLESTRGNAIFNSSGEVNSILRKKLQKKHGRKVTSATLSTTLGDMKSKGIIAADTNGTRTYGLWLNEKKSESAPVAIKHPSTNEIATALKAMSDALVLLSKALES